MADPRSIHKLLRIQNEFQKLYPSMPASMSLAFLTIAYLDEPTSIEIASHAQLTRSAASRYTQDLGEGKPSTKAYRPVLSLGLVEGRSDPLDRRTLRFRLTPKGKALLDLLIRIVEA
jgi:DNA-binding MarR family transcriptional regulator